MSIILSQKRQQEIDRVAREFEITTQLNTLDDNIYNMALAIGIEVIVDNLKNIDAGIHGAILYPEDNSQKPTIFIEKDLINTRKIFTLAHELGHYFLHSHQGVKYRTDGYKYDIRKESIEEVEANYFAGTLLMPKGLILKKVAEGLSTQELANYFGVSKTAIRVRLEWLNA